MLRSFVFRFAKQKPLDAFKSFLEHDAGSSVRQEVHHKDRKYANVEVARDFKRQEENRKKLRMQQMAVRKNLLQQKLSTESKLLTSQEDEELKKLNNQITTLQQLLDKQSKDLATIDKQLQQTEAQMVLVEGARKLVVLNKIQYLKHLNMHPSGLVLHPETIKIIENVHYLVNNNLPVNKYKLFEIMPDVFQTEIGELEQSMRKLIEEKKLDPLSDPSGRIRFFVRHHSRFQHPEQQIIDLQEQRDQVFDNLQDEAVRMLDPHMEYVRKVDLGETPFRNTYHLIAVMLADNINLNFSEEQSALRKTIRQIIDLRRKFDIYSDEVNKQVIKMRYRYIEPPQFVKNHPVLLQRYEKLMVKYTNPEQESQTLQIETSNDDGGRAYLEQKILKVVIQKYHPIIEQLWNSGKKEQLIAMKKQLQIDFYNDSTKVLEEYHDMLLQQKQKEEFLKLPKKTREIPEQAHGLLNLDDLTKTIMVNNSNPVKYNLGFFTNYFGLESQEQTRKLFNSISYLRVPVQEQKTIDKLKFEIIKFKKQ